MGLFFDHLIDNLEDPDYGLRMRNKKFEKGDMLRKLTTTRADGSKFTCFYVYETAMSWDLYDGQGKKNVEYSYAPYDGVSIVITDNGD